MPRKRITQPAAVEVESALTAEELTGLGRIVDLVEWVLHESPEHAALRIYRAEAEVERLGQALARVHALHAREDIPAFVYRITDEDGTRDEPHEAFSRCVHCGGSTYPCKTIETNL